MSFTTAERESAQQLLANGWKPAKIAHALVRARVRNAPAHGRRGEPLERLAPNRAFRDFMNRRAAECRRLNDLHGIGYRNPDDPASDR